MLSRGLLLLGSTGFGKSTLAYQVVDGILRNMTGNDLLLIFDSKQDFIEKYFRPGDVVVSTLPQHRSAARSWNLFAECFPAGADLKDPDTVSEVNVTVKEIAKGLFRSLNNDSQPFFPMAAQGCFGAVMSGFIEDAVKAGDFTRLRNSCLLDFLDGATTEQLLSFARGRYRYLHSYLGNPAAPTPQSLGVEAFLHAMTDDIFIDSFRYPLPSGDFSMRRLISDKGGKIVFLEYDPSRGETLAPVISLLLDLAIKEQLRNGKGKLYLMLDEFARLPKCEMLSSAVNFGRSKGIVTIAGVQAVTQLYENYEEFGGKNLLAAFCNAICFRSVDAETREYITGRFGRTFDVYRYGETPLQREGYTVEDSVINNLPIGAFAADLLGSKPFLFYGCKPSC